MIKAFESITTGKFASSKKVSLLTVLVFLALC